jgi:spermidine synthase
MAYEVSWQRMLSLALGATLRSSALVLSAFMLGMGLGSRLLGKLADKKTARPKLVGWLHWAMAFSCLWSLALISLIPIVYRWPQGGVAAELAAHLVAVAALIPGAVATGGMLPATASAGIADKKEIGKGVGLLYSLEALGSMAGVAAAGFFIIRYLGQTGTLAAAMSLNLAIGAVLICGRWRPKQGVMPKKEKSGSTARDQKPSLLLIALALGLVGMSLQVVWNRAVRIYLPNSSYTFATVAAVYLAGLFAGNLLFLAVVGRLRQMMQWLYAGLAALAATIASGVFLLENVPRLFLFPWAGLLGYPWARIYLPPVLVTAGLAIIPTILLGFCSPLTCRLYADRMGKVGGDIGRLRAVNTLGSAVGPTLAGLVLIPLAGVSRSIWLLSGLTALAALAAAENNTGRGLAKLVLGTILAAACLTWTLISKPVMILPPSLHRGQEFGDQAAKTLDRKDEVIYYRETGEGTVIVTEDSRTGIRACYVNNSAVVGTTYDAIKAVKMLGHLPALLGEKPRRALVIGFGIGVTASTVASHPSVESVDCVEITPGLRQAARYFNEFNRGVGGNPKIKFVDGDGRTYLNRTWQKYDLISADPTHPTLGCAQLYTREYFLLCRQHLNEGGTICQYLPFHGLTPSEFAGAAAAFATVFPESNLWLGHSHGIMIGWIKRRQVDFQEWKRRVESLDDPLFYKNPYALAACLLLDEKGIARLTSGKRPCSDDFNFLEYFNPSAKDPANWERNLSMVLNFRADPKSFFAGNGDSLVLGRYKIGQNVFIGSMKEQNRGDRAGMIRAMQEAVRAAPDNEEFRFLLQQELGRGAW